RDRCLRKERPNSKAGTIPRTAPRTSPGDVGGRTTTNPAVPPPIQDDSNTSTRDYCHATIAHRAKRGRRRNRRNAARLGTEPSPTWPSACKLRHTTIANPQLSISCATFLPIIVSYAPAFSIEARQDVGALGEMELTRFGGQWRSGESEGEPRCPRVMHGMRRNTGAEWWSWCAQGVVPTISRRSSSRRPSRFATGWRRWNAIRAVALMG